MSNAHSPEEGQSLEQKVERALELLRRGRRHWPVILACFVLGAGGGSLAAIKMKKVYRSESLILYREAVDRRSVTGEQDHPDVEAELKKLLWSKTDVMKILDELKLYKDLREVMTPEAIFQQFLGKFEMRARGGDTFWFAFEHSDPVKTKLAVEKVTDYLTTGYNTMRDNKLSGTLNYLEETTKKARARVTDLQEQISKFIREHPELVTNQDGSVTVGSGATLRAARSPAARAHRISVTTPEIRALQSEKGKLVAQLNLLTGQPAEPAPVAQQDGPDPQEEELREARAELQRKKMEYTDQHPDVIRLKKRVEQLTMSVARKKRPAAARIPASAMNDPQVQELQKQIRDLDDRIGRAQRAALAGSKKDDTAPVDNAPKAVKDLAAEWSRLNFELQLAKGELEEYESRRQKEKLIVDSQKVGTRFEVRDPAFLPQKPIKPNKKKIAGIGLALGLMLGLGYAAARVLIDPKIHDVTDLRAVTNLPVLAVIPRGGQKAA